MSGKSLASVMKTAIDDEGERGVKIVPVEIVANVRPITVKLQGSTNIYPAKLMQGTTLSVGEQCYAFWWPGKIPLIVFKAT